MEKVIPSHLFKSFKRGLKKNLDAMAVSMVDVTMELTEDKKGVNVHPNNEFSAYLMGIYDKNIKEKDWNPEEVKIEQ